MGKGPTAMGEREPGKYPPAWRWASPARGSAWAAVFTLRAAG